MIKIAYSEVYKYKLPTGHRFPMDKYELLPMQLLHEGLVSKENFFHPEKLDKASILLTHTESYWNQIHNLPLERKLERAIGFPVREDLIERGKHIAMGTLQCAEYAMQYGVSLNIAGGTHHSFADRGEGFCIYNDFAIAANILLHQKKVRQVLIVDLDVHQGNGTANIFQNRPEVFTFSMHGEKNYPLRKEKSDLDIGLPDDTEDKYFLERLKPNLSDILDSIKPDIIFYLSGVDVIKSDKLGRLALTIDGCKQRDTFVFGEARKRNIPIAVSMGGGYAPEIKHIIEAHANTYRAAFEIF